MNASEWRVNEKEVFWELMLEAIGPGFRRKVTVKDMFPDAHKMTIAKRLKEWDVDIMDMPIEVEYRRDVIMAAAGSDGTLLINPDHAIDIRNKFTPQHLYLTLAHELAHFLQYVENRLDERVAEMGSKWRQSGVVDPHEWISLVHEREAIQWGARQAKQMGMSQKTFNRFEMANKGIVAKEIPSIVSPVFAGTHPEERGVRPMFRRPPVRVRQHRRSK